MLLGLHIYIPNILQFKNAALLILIKLYKLYHTYMVDKKSKPLSNYQKNLC